MWEILPSSSGGWDLWNISSCSASAPITLGLGGLPKDSRMKLLFVAACALFVLCTFDNADSSAYDKIVAHSRIRAKKEGWAFFIFLFLSLFVCCCFTVHAWTLNSSYHFCTFLLVIFRSNRLDFLTAPTVSTVLSMFEFCFTFLVFSPAGVAVIMHICLASTASAIAIIIHSWQADVLPIWAVC